MALEVLKHPKTEDMMEVDSPGFEPDGETVLLVASLLRGLRLA